MITPSNLLRLMTFAGIGLFVRAIMRESAQAHQQHLRLAAPLPQPKRRRRAASAQDAETVE